MIFQHANETSLLITSSDADLKIVHLVSHPEHYFPFVTADE
jgi:hypothetical protein